MKGDEIKVGAILSYVIIALSTITGILYTPFMLRQLGQSEYGLYMLIGSLVGYISILDFGLHNTMYRFIAKYQAEKDNENQENFLAACFIIYGIITVLVLVVGAILFLNLESIFSKSLTSDELYKAQIMFVVLIINLALSLPMGAFQFIIMGYGKFIFANSVSIARIILRTAVLIGLLSLGYKSIAIVVIDTVFNIAMGLTYLFYCFYKLRVNIKVHTFNKSLLKEILNYSLFVFILAMVNQMFWQIGQVTLGIIASTAAVAIYALSISLVIYYQNLALGISGVFMPKVIGLIAKGATGEDLTDLMVKVGRVQLSILGLVLTGFIILGKQFILLWAGSEYSQIYWITVLLFIPLTIQMIQTIGGVILQAKNMQSFKAKAYLIMSVLNLFLSIFLARVLGPLGIGIATALSIIVFQIIIINLYYYYKVDLNVPRFFKQTSKGLLPAMILSIIIGFGTLFLSGSGWASLFYRVVLVTIIYAVMMCTIGFNNDEKNMFIKPILRMLKIEKKLFKKQIKSQKDSFDSITNRR